MKETYINKQQVYYELFLCLKILENEKKNKGKWLIYLDILVIF